VDTDRPGGATRDNGLRCGGYTPLADLDPRLADALLDALRDNGIAAYAGPTPAATGHYMEMQLPDRPIDRLWVDDQQVDRARAIVDRERADAAAVSAEPVEPAEPATPAPDATTAGDTDIDFDAAWQQLLGSLQEAPSTSSLRITGDTVARREPASYGVEQDEDYDDDGYDPADLEHYEPPPPPPLPRLRKATAAALTAIVLGLLVLATDLEDGGFTFLAIAAIVGGVVSLIWNMRQGPPPDSGWDDGAVV
jgi:hypothetical protein